ncbi:cytochrome P450 [Sphingomonadaceae bacterium G21617-S1]|jgi:cytochrome P450|uniref:cytochrome P450 n=1 Tax=Rhizorhabdus sp. TaxID=1968843 RepID=UPI001212EF56|nr:cytochrome P450 [Rhizorhabdus sp.]MBD3760391.1 cytochrome P450 [Rhizorhabdus sp.]MCZ4340077.1 cytochrome P450 [Sphingomonadaceae bacterium G21617-S1]TAK08544.1 MAG: cytochrome P450 [Rhizorhabdus sp.]
MVRSVPQLDIDPYSLEALADPYPNYRRVRDTGPVVYLPKYGVYALGRFDEVRDALANWRSFSSAQGVAMNDVMNAAIAGGTLGSDDPHHAALRAIVGRPLSPARLAQLRKVIFDRAEVLVENLVVQGRFDAATELAQHLPLTVVSELVGLPEDGRSRMLVWAAANFNSLGPRGVPLTEEALPIIREMVDYAYSCTRDRIKPGSWVAELYEASDRGEIASNQVAALMNDYVGPSLDTTIFAISNLIFLFAQYPEQWARLRSNPAKIPNAINESIRLESPAQSLSRMTVRDVRIGDYPIPKGSRFSLMFASANRDERKWTDPDIFDIDRRTTDHLGFGHGIHTCLGANLARLEIAAIVSALVKRVERIELVGAERRLNNVLRGFGRLEVKVH